MKIKKSFILLMVTIQLFSITVFSIEPDKTYAQEEMDAMTQGIMTLSQMYGVSEQQIDQEIANGYSLNDIQKALIVSKTSGRSYLEVLEIIKPEFVNTSATTESIVKSELPDGYQILSYSNQNELTVPKVDPSNLLKSISAKASEAPYYVIQNQESFSTVSGALAFEQIDATLPGRNGLSFSLKRTYNSQDAQMNAMKIGTVDDKIYEINALFKVDTKRREYWGKANYRRYVQYDFDCDENIEFEEPTSDTTLLEVTGATSESSVINSLNKYDEKKWSTCKPIGDTPLPNSLRSLTNNVIAQYSSITTREVFKSEIITIDYDYMFIKSEEDEEQFVDFSLTEDEANSKVEEIRKFFGKTFSADFVGTKDSFELYKVKRIVGTRTESHIVGISSIYNTEEKPLSEKKFPIGKGWTWNIPFIELKEVGNLSKQYVHMGDGSAYEVDESSLKDFMWKGTTFEEDHSVTQAEVPSKYAVKTLKGVNYYFDNGGNLLVISDSYGNKIRFTYKTDPTYGYVLSTIEDDIGNQISIGYSTDEVVITNGKKKTYYKKTIKEGKELLTQVIGPLEQTTTYDYLIKPARFSLINTLPDRENPYFLLTGITHPTGAKTVYKYEDVPTTRYIASDAVNQVYRLIKRYDEVADTINPEQVRYNQKELTYVGDMGSSYSEVPTFSTTVTNKQTKTTYFNEKVIKSADDTPTIYTTQVKETGSSIEKVVEYSYDRDRKITLPIETTSYNQNVDDSTVKSKPVKTSIRYTDYGYIKEESSDLETNTYDYRLDSIELAPKEEKERHYKKYVLVSQSTRKKKSEKGETQTIITKYLYDNYEDGNIKQQKISTTTNDTILSKSEGTFDIYGNLTGMVQYQSYKSSEDNKKAVYTINYDEESNYAFPKDYKVEFNNEKSTITMGEEHEKESGLTTKVTDGNGNVVYIEYDKEDRPTKVTYVDPAKMIDQSPSLKYLYNDEKNEMSIIDVAGIETKYAWNPLGWKTAEYLLENGIYKSKLQQGYDEYGRVLITKDARGATTTNFYDEFDRPTMVQMPDYKSVNNSETGGKMKYKYDDINHIITTTDLDKNSLEAKFDEFGRPISKDEKWFKDGSVKSRVLEKITYTGDDYTVEDGKGFVTAYTMDALGRLKSVVQPSSDTVPEKIETSYEYDFTGNLLSTKDGSGKTRKNVYDELGRVIQKIDGAGAVENFEYDAKGNLVKYKDKAETVFENLYNYRNQLIERKAIKGSTTIDKVTYQWDDGGRQTKMVDSTGATEYSYYLPTDPESVGLLKSVVLPDKSSFTYTYNPNGSRDSMQVQVGTSSPWTIWYNYDEVNRLTNVEASEPNNSRFNISESYSYTNGGLLKSSSKNNDTSSEATYKGRLLSSLSDKKESDNSFINNYSMKYDANANITEIMDNGIQKKFTYDSLDQILNSSVNNENYSYTPSGDRKNHMTEATFPTETVEYEYDVHNRLTQVQMDENKVGYKYSGQGLLYERTEKGETRRYYYDGDQIVAEAKVINGEPQLLARYIRGQGNQLIAKVSEKSNEKTAFGGVAYYHYNNHGDVVALTDITGKVLKEYQYDIWGNPISAGGNNVAVENPFRYSGEYWDESTNLQYLRARWYDPGIGRFITEDTYEGDVKKPQSLNLYTYVENNPITHVDPSGHWPGSVSDTIPEFGSGGGFPVGALVGVTVIEAAVAAIGKAISSIIREDKDSTVKIYRAMDYVEYNKFMKYGRFSSEKPIGKEWIMDTKWFATNIADAEAWGTILNPHGFKIVEITIKKSALAGMYYNPYLDNVGPAYNATVPYINGVMISYRGVK